MRGSMAGVRTLEGVERENDEGNIGTSDTTEKHRGGVPIERNSGDKRGEREIFGESV